MWVCSGKNNDSWPRSSASRAIAAGSIAPWVGNIATPVSMTTKLEQPSRTANQRRGGLHRRWPLWCAGMWPWQEW